MYRTKKDRKHVAIPVTSAGTRKQEAPGLLAVLRPVCSDGLKVSTAAFSRPFLLHRPGSSRLDLRPLDPHQLGAQSHVSPGERLFVRDGSSSGHNFRSSADLITTTAQTDSCARW